jgi:hypothetical protein
MQKQGQMDPEDEVVQRARGIEVLPEESMANHWQAIVAGSFDAR